MGFQSLEAANVEGEKVLLRTDINLPIENGEPQKTVRFDTYMETVRELSERGAKTVIIAHQGRPARKDFRSLDKHAELVDKEIENSCYFVPAFFGSQLEDIVEKMEDGDVALLENIRMLSEELQNVPKEQHAHDIFVEKLASKFNFFVNDAFSASHRSHGSLVGFNQHLESYAGKIMEEELESLGKVRDEVKNPVLVLGGEKPSDIIGFIQNFVDRAEKIYLTGIPGELGLIVSGSSLGKKEDWISEKGFDAKKEELGKLLSDYEEKIVLPEDVVTDSGEKKVGEVGDEMVWDIGSSTAEKISEGIKQAESVLLKGPAGAFEEGYENGTKKILEAMAETDAYTVMGGGHTSSLVKRFGFEDSDFDHVSIAGGAFVRFMSGEKLPGVEALEKYS